MSDLQIGLISLGVVLLLAVVLFNWWQDRRIRQKMQDHFPEGDQDPLMGGPVPGSVRREPRFALRDDNEDLAPDDPAEVDPGTEVVIDISFAQPVPVAQLHPAVQSIHKVGSKPVRIFAERDGGGHRSRLRPNESYMSMQLAVLLANRSGPLTAIEWSQLWTLAQSLAERFDGAIEGPEQDYVLQRAKELDALCAGLDAQVGLTLRLPGTQAVTEVTRLVKEVGFLEYGKQLAWMAETGIPRFTLLFDGVQAGLVQSAGVDRLDLLLDLPNSPADEQAFSRMASVGRDLAGRLGAILLDDQGRPVSEGADRSVDEQLLKLYRGLERAGFPAGSDRTVRVFA